MNLKSVDSSSHDSSPSVDSSPSQESSSIGSSPVDSSKPLNSYVSSVVNSVNGSRVRW